VVTKAQSTAQRSRSRGKGTADKPPTDRSFNLSAQQKSQASHADPDEEALARKRAQTRAALRAEESADNAQEEMRLSKASDIAK